MPYPRVRSTTGKTGKNLDSALVKNELFSQCLEDFAGAI